MPEGLARVLDMMNSAIAPKVVTPTAIGANATPATPSGNQTLHRTGVQQPQIGGHGGDAEAQTVVASLDDEPRPRVYREVRPPRT